MTALEDLVAQEEVCVRHGDYEAVADAQERAAPLVEYLVGHADAVTDPALRARVGELLDRRGQTLARMAEDVARTRQELDSLGASHRTAAKIAPAYGFAKPARSTLRAKG